MTEERTDFRSSAVVGFCEEMEGLLLAAGLKEQRPDLLALLPPCERKFIEGEGWKESLDVLWRKAQELRVMFGSEEARDSRRGCVGGHVAGCDECRDADAETMEAIEKICWDSKFTKWNKWRRRYPYGVWACADGEEYLFNRDYQPFLRRSAGGYVTGVESERPREPWIDFVRQGWFYSSNPPQDLVATQRLLVAVMEAFHAGRDVWEFVENERSPKKLEVVK
jgi:hypothetical protein